MYYQRGVTTIPDWLSLGQQQSILGFSQQLPTEAPQNLAMQNQYKVLPIVHREQRRQCSS